MTERTSESKTSTLTMLSRACRRLVESFDSFWILAGLTDYSFEEGVRNAAYRGAIEAYSAGDIPIPDALREELHWGINGNLQVILENDVPLRGGVARNMGKGQDLLLSAQGRPLARVEVKLVYDCTQPKYYPMVAADLNKLTAVRKGGCTEDLFLAVFFIQFPNYAYPPREGLRGVQRMGIASQFDQIQKRLAVQPVWPGPRPHQHALRAPSDARVYNALQRTFDTRYEASGMPSRLDHHIRDAAVGAAIWACGV